MFGAEDPYLNPGVARDFHRLFPAATLTLVGGAAHYVQLDRPERVATVILEVQGSPAVGKN